MLKVGDIVMRMLGGQVECPLEITAITKDKIICGLWEFDPKTGAEIDEDLGWGPPPKMTGSFLRRKNGEFEVLEDGVLRAN